ncbi:MULTISPECIES: tRNA (5-methylaminomethyl-2-thiouridine)(34)-methyltransferase MnmD [unclassified Polaribacter]|uniref:tRNA (5-methylaminomethyl-2-thiouridine)(34)-methyltransferase MnmD n=1 Tax=unclassified Polaribacter TaxID=196858 RepID=UPI0011BE1F91|nr:MULTISPECIES: tRNA (5-methylaminomethyl-2-thiouridine)(34)-methyltransferase MnmD [unclassified Polaribacter]TXD53277.1 tRNA (5-methylaminomethyl-2-thiouridine)(34)-methyltransferase MnmD [Polaribacter sp. IC063]TXD60270.1 tRNA (5-methylaminomethyl-2-thiouridine)(34)-methyltransferase MnmD [Polaribacter sp. IC066]
MKREILITSDGSTTIHLPDWDEQYHSKHGAIQEAYHVFIKSGLDKVLENNLNEVSILEIGFGTGLNAFITFLEGNKKKIKIEYVGVEAYPVVADEVEKLNYVSELNSGAQQAVFEAMHDTSWEEKQAISEVFQLTKRKQFFADITDENAFNLIYFDAFGAKNQPELWTEEIFQKMFNALKTDGVLVTYAAKGSVRRAMQTVGFTVERLAGPPGKREMLRAIKN